MYKQNSKKRVFSRDWKDIPVTISQADFQRLRKIIDSLCSLSSLAELQECRLILLHALYKHWELDLKSAIHENY